MPENSQGRGFGDVDFEEIYRGKPPIQGGAVEFVFAPWDIGEPQPALVELEEGGRLRGEILDAGCGPGDNAVFLAERGYRVTGVDVASSAIERARERARDRGVDLEFVVGDATRLDGVTRRFDTVLDSALYHCFTDEQRAEYAAALHRVTWPGAELHLFCAADTGSAGLRLPLQVSQDNLRAHLGGHWTIESVDLTDYTTAFTREVLEQRADAFAALGIGIDIDALRTDRAGRVTFPAWQLHAIRK